MSMHFHYAPWSYLRRIVDSGMLLPSNAGAPDEPCLLWFSAHQQWEPTASKLWTKGGATVRLTFRQQEEKVGCMRFGLKANDPRLLSWEEACRYAGIPRAERRNLEAVGRRLGANPAHWFASTLPVQLRDLDLQVWVDGWKRSDDPEGMAQAFESRTAA